MAKDTLYNYNPAAPVTISREEYNNVGSGDLILGDVKRAFMGSTDFEIWTLATGGAQLVEDTDYEIINKDSDYTLDAGYDVYTGFKIINASYQTGYIYVTYKCLGSYVDSEIINDINDRLDEIEDSINDRLDEIEDSITEILPVNKRQTVMSGSVDTTGFPDFLAIGTGLVVDGTGSESEPVVCTWANGVTENPYDYKSSIIAAFQFTSLNAYSNPYLYIENDGLGTLTYGHSVYAPVNGLVFNGVDAGAILANFEGTHGATTYTDAYNNVWTLANGASLSNAVKKFNATTSLYLAGTDDYAECPAPDMSGKWTIEFWFYPTDATRAAVQCLLSSKTEYYGPLVQITTGGKLEWYLSSNGSSYNLMNGTDGNSTLSDNTWYHLALVFDGAKYKAYLNGSEETNMGATSSVSIMQAPTLRTGVKSDGTTGDFFGYIEGFRFSPYARYTASFTAPVAALTTDEQHFFDLNTIAMYKGAPAAWTKTLRLFIGECVTGASSVSSVATYALNGYYDSGWFSVSASTTYTKSHNIGSIKYNITLLGKTSTGIIGQPANLYNTTLLQYEILAYSELKRKSIKIRTGALVYIWQADAPNRVTADYAKITLQRNW